MKRLMISSLSIAGLVSAQLVPGTTDLNALQTPMPSPSSTQRLNDIALPSCPPYEPGLLFPYEQMYCLPCPTRLPSGLYSNDEKACTSATPRLDTPPIDTNIVTDYSVTPSPSPKLDYIKVSSQPCNDWKCPPETDMIIYQNRTMCVFSYEPVMVEGCVQFNADGACLKMGLVPTCPQGGEVILNKCRILSMPTWMKCVTPSASMSATPSMTMRVVESPSSTPKVVPSNSPSMTRRIQESPSSTSKVVQVESPSSTSKVVQVESPSSTPKVVQVESPSSTPCMEWICPNSNIQPTYTNLTSTPVCIYNKYGASADSRGYLFCPNGGYLLEKMCYLYEPSIMVPCGNYSVTPHVIESPSQTPRVQEKPSESPSQTPKVAERTMSSSMTARVQEKPSESSSQTPKVAERTMSPSQTARVQEKPSESSSQTPRVQEKPSESPSMTVRVQEKPSESPSQTPRVQEKPSESPSMTARVQEKPSESPSMTARVQEKPSESPSQTPKVAERTMSPSQTSKYDPNYTAEPTEMHPYDPLPSQQTRESVSSTPFPSIPCNSWYCPADYRLYVTAVANACLSRINAPYNIIDMPSTPEGQSGGSYPQYYCPQGYTFVDRIFCEHRMKALWKGCYTESPTQTPYPTRKLRTNVAYITVKPRPSLVRISPKPVLVKDMVLTLMATDPTVVMDTISEVKDILSVMYNVSVEQIHIKGIRRKIMGALWNITMSESPKVRPLTRMLQQVGDQTLVDYLVNTTNPAITTDISPMLNDYILRVIDPAIVQQYLGPNVSVNDIAHLLYSVADGIQIAAPSASPSSSKEHNLSLGEVIGVCVGAVAVASVLTALFATSAANRRNKVANTKMFNSGGLVPVITPSNINSTAIVNNKAYGINNMMNEYPPLPNMV